VSRFDSPASMSPLEEATIAALRVAQGPLAVIGIEQSAMRCGDAVANSTRQAIVAADAAEAGCR